MLLICLLVLSMVVLVLTSFCFFVVGSFRWLIVAQCCCCSMLLLLMSLLFHHCVVFVADCCVYHSPTHSIAMNVVYFTFDLPSYCGSCHGQDSLLLGVCSMSRELNFYVECNYLGPLSLQSVANTSTTILYSHWSIDHNKSRELLKYIPHVLIF